MNIALVSLQFEKTATGGGGVHVMKITDEYLKSGHNITIFSIHTALTEGDADDTGRRNNLKVVRVLVDSGIASPYEGKKAVELDRIRRFCDLTVKILKEREDDFDVVHMHGHHMIPGYMARELKGSGFKVVSTIHFLESTLADVKDMEHLDMTDEQCGNLKEWEAMTSEADSVVVISPGQREDFIRILEDFKDEYNVDKVKKKLHLISSGIKDSSILPEEEIIKKWENAGKEVNILSYSRLDPSKGSHFSIRVLPELTGISGDSIKLTVAGISARGYESILQSEKAKLDSSMNCELVFFDSIAEEEERNSFMDKFDVYMFPTLSEPFGITIIEAAARGLFVITTDSAGPSYILKGGNIEEYSWGYVSDYGINVKLTQSPEKNLVPHLISAWKWFENSRENALEKALNFRKVIINKYTWRGVVRQYLELY